ncbi:PAS domain-containing protein [bacterium]|nr:PAS domain-containing protein [bacterium]
MLERLETLDAPTLATLAQRLGRERGLFERVFNVLQEGVLVVDADGEIAYANAAAHRLLGLKEADSAAPTLWRLVPGLQALLGPALANASSLTREIELSYPEPRTVRLYLVPFDSPGAAAAPAFTGDARRFAVVLTDLTRDKLDTDQRIESERVASIVLLAAGVAHELGNPLNSLTIQLQLVERRLRKLRGLDKKDAAGLADSLRVCQGEVARLDGIIANFLQAIRPRPPDLADTRLTDVLAEVLSFQERELADRGIQVEVTTAAGLPLVRADRDQVKQVFFNVIKNAAEAMQPGGHLRITARVDEQYLLLAFADTGSGIKPEHLARLFEPYHTTKPGGHGLGMMVVQRILREHGGQIVVESDSHRGTTVTLQFPLKQRRVRLLRS